MKRISVIVAAVAAVSLALSGCGSSDESTDANGLRKGSTTAAATTTAAPRPTTTAAAPTPASGTPAPTTTADQPAASGAATTCAQFKTLDSAGEKAVIEQILAENPESPFAGSPNVALGTAKLVCLSSSNADKTVARAAGITS